jgi:hypothetical protein
MIREKILLPVFISTLVYGLLCFQEGSAQTLTKLKEWNSKDIAQVSVDRLGNFLILSKKGEIKKYDPDGKVMARLRKKKPTLIEPWYHPSIFIYDRPSQKYFFYGRFFETVREYNLPAEYAIEPYLVCPTHDNRLWILDKADYTLKKINPLNSEVENEFTLTTDSYTPVFTFMCEYQNLIFLREKNAIWIINSLGKIITKIESDELGNFGFFGQELYYLENNTVYFINLLTEERYELQLEGNLRFALVTDERILTISSDNKVFLYNYVPGQG